MVLNQQRSVRVPVAALEDFLGRVQRALRVGACEVTVCLVSDARIRRLNRVYRRKDRPTDVLSFPAGEGIGPNGAPGRRGRPPGCLGDIAIAPATARRNARRTGRALAHELRVLVLHGVLHLVGYDHETDRGEMARVEARLRRRLGLALS